MGVRRMKIFVFTLFLNLFWCVNFVAAEEKIMTRADKANEVFRTLFQAERVENPTDPEFMEILQRNIFGEVFFTGNLTHKEREMITVVSLATMQTLPQLKAHINAALNVGNTPLEIREAIYQCAPFIGFPKTLNAIGVFNEVAKERNIKLPLEKTGTTTDEDRHLKGLEIQQKLYGDEVKKAMAKLDKAETVYVESGAKAYAQEVSQAVRDYIEAVHNLPAPERTTEEFLQIAAASPQLDEKERGILESILKLADIAKFAQHSFRGEEKSELLTDAREFLAHDNDKLAQKQKSEKTEPGAPAESLKDAANATEESEKDEPTVVK